MTRVALDGLSKPLAPHVPLGKSRLETLCLLVLGVITHPAILSVALVHRMHVLQRQDEGLKP
jgi:hypothetical protein